MSDLVQTVKDLGFSEKAARLYLAALELGEATVLQLARQSGQKRTTIYYTLDELVERGALVAARRRKKVFYVPEPPAGLLKRARERLSGFESAIAELEQVQGKSHVRPQTYFLFGPDGFKKTWDMVFASKSREFRIITPGEDFLDYVHEKYILDEIIQTKRKLGVSSRQLITDSPYARKIAAKDLKENRQTRFLPAACRLSFTEIIADSLVAFISPRFENTILVIDNESFARSRRALFDVTWNALPTPAAKARL